MLEQNFDEELSKKLDELNIEFKSEYWDAMKTRLDDHDRDKGVAVIPVVNPFKKHWKAITATAILFSLLNAGIAYYIAHKNKATYNIDSTHRIDTLYIKSVENNRVSLRQKEIEIIQLQKEIKTIKEQIENYKVYFVSLNNKVSGSKQSVNNIRINKLENYLEDKIKELKLKKADYNKQLENNLKNKPKLNSAILRDIEENEIYYNSSINEELTQLNNIADIIDSVQKHKTDTLPQDVLDYIAAYKKYEEDKAKNKERNWKPNLAVQVGIGNNQYVQPNKHNKIGYRSRNQLNVYMGERYGIKFNMGYKVNNYFSFGLSYSRNPQQLYYTKENRFYTNKPLDGIYMEPNLFTSQNIVTYKTQYLGISFLYNYQLTDYLEFFGGAQLDIKLKEHSEKSTQIGGEAAANYYNYNSKTEITKIYSPINILTIGGARFIYKNLYFELAGKVGLLDINKNNSIALLPELNEINYKTEEFAKVETYNETPYFFNKYNIFREATFSIGYTINTKKNNTTKIRKIN